MQQNKKLFKFGQEEDLQIVLSLRKQLLGTRLIRRNNLNRNAY